MALERLILGFVLGSSKVRWRATSCTVFRLLYWFVFKDVRRGRGSTPVVCRKDIFSFFDFWYLIRLVVVPCAAITRRCINFWKKRRLGRSRGRSATYAANRRRTSSPWCTTVTDRCATGRGLDVVAISITLQGPLIIIGAVWVYSLAVYIMWMRHGEDFESYLNGTFVYFVSFYRWVVFVGSISLVVSSVIR